ncbi:hypothetical protein PPTG_24838 [Phytophthora nicotianae INRA-310]|uniref:Uncharacterized protein n=1 Tax=Phytophthora nicotianae (strain INRA-310) TaxID=761204 RepID=W2P9Q7_PHYN3|nr:hypothetical protein PPTG_24838 [Phytophthora nicotianae INRA-310]ETM97762.1 hypothetical protein PPTG_24838 [Phytophthora nicotianae INRA-310]
MQVMFSSLHEVILHQRQVAQIENLPLQSRWHLPERFQLYL